jgi:hypothetical protein
MTRAAPTDALEAALAELRALLRDAANAGAFDLLGSDFAVRVHAELEDRS